MGQGCKDVWCVIVVAVNRTSVEKLWYDKTLAWQVLITNQTDPRPFVASGDLALASMLTIPFFFEMEMDSITHALHSRQQWSTEDSLEEGPED